MYEDVKCKDFKVSEDGSMITIEFCTRTTSENLRLTLPSSKWARILQYQARALDTERSIENGIIKAVSIALKHVSKEALK